MNNETVLTLLQELSTQSSKLKQDNIYWVPIRHHSPACAYALQKLIEEVNPISILIEGPSDCQSLVEHIQHEDAKPPLAFLTQKGSAEDIFSAYFPLCDYSPEWVAIQCAKRSNANLKFIDLPYESRTEAEKSIEEPVQNLMSERFLAHSEYLKKIAEQLNCRDHHESWDRLFEQRSLDELKKWAHFFNDVFTYCTLARRDYEPEVIKASGDEEREKNMLAYIVHERQKETGAIVVVTGGFHTPALIEAYELEKKKKHTIKAKEENTEDKRNWLIRYSFDQLDSLNGYSAGMPSPYYYQKLWEQLQEENSDYLKHSAAALLVSVAHDNRQQNLTQMISSAEVKAAVFHAEGLAQLRDAEGPGRSEILDAVLSCFVKDATAHSTSTLADARRILCGDKLGEIPEGITQPPLVQEAWQSGKKLGLKFEQTQIKSIELELYRKTKHKEISQYFHLMQWIGSSLAVWQGGPDFINGHQLGLVREHWQYAWTPQVESQLIQLMHEGPTLEHIALKKLQDIESDLEAQGQGRVSSTAAQLLTRACILGLQEHVLELASRIETLIHQDEHLSSVIDCAYQLKALERGKAYLDSDELNLDLNYLYQKCWKNSLYLIPRLAELNDDNAEEALTAFRQQHIFSQELSDEREFYWQLVRELLDNSGCPALLRGASLGILFLDGRISSLDLDLQLAIFLAPGQLAEITVNGLRGFIAISKESLWRSENLLAKINQQVTSWSEEHFLSVLPSLRLLFTELAPKEVDKVAENIAQLIGIDKVNNLRESVLLSPQEIEQLAVLDGVLSQNVEALGLETWFMDPEQGELNERS